MMVRRGKASWTDGLLPDEDSSPEYRSVIEAFFAVDWANNPMGPLDTWDYSTRSCVTVSLQTMLSPVLLIMGPSRIVIYNTLAMKFYRDRHPKLMGQSHEEGFSDIDQIWDLVASVEHNKKVGKAHLHEIQPIRMWRSLDAPVEENLLSWEFVPLLDDAGEYSSVICTFQDHTQVIREKQRAQFLAKLHDSLARTTTCAEYYESCLQLMRDSILGFQFLDIYTSDVSSVKQSVVSFDRDSSEASMLNRKSQTRPWVDHVSTTLVPLMTRTSCESRLTETLTYVFPIIPESETSMMAHTVVLGSNVGHVIDELHETFLKSCASTIATAMGLIESSILLKQSDTRFQEMLLRTTIGFNLEDEKTRLPIFVNDAWRHMTGFWAPLGNIDTPEADFGALLHPHGRDKFMADYIALTKDTPLHNRDVRLLRPYKPENVSEQHPDDSVWLRVSSTYLPPSYKSPASLLFTVTDVSYYKYLERIRLEELGRAVELQKLKSESTFERERANAAERSAAKHLQYIDFSSHELRNPLGAIMQAVDLSTLILKAYKNNCTDIEEVMEHLSSIMVCAKHMGRIVDDTLSFSQLDHGALQIALLPCKIDITVLNVLTMFKAELNVKKIALDCQIEDTGTVMTDASRFSQILINMLTNALKFAPQDGTGRIRVSLSTSQTRGKLRIDCRVSDNGPGMSPDVIASLFQKFSQASAKTHIQYGGSGLGLYISKRLTELLGGEIEAISSPGQGSQLHFYIMAEAVNTVLSPRVPQGRANSPMRTAVDRKNGAKKTLLIVEDNIVNQRLMTKLLSSHYDIHTANNGLECLELMQSSLGKTIDLVLCDIEMPIMNGYEAVRQVKEWQIGRGETPVPFLAVSANSRPEQVQLMLDAGMNNTIRKPFGRNDILNTVGSMLQA